jgi:hypothetical protein
MAAGKQLCSGRSGQRLCAGTEQSRQLWAAPALSTARRRLGRARSRSSAAVPLADAARCGWRRPGWLGVCDGKHSVGDAVNGGRRAADDTLRLHCTLERHRITDSYAPGAGGSRGARGRAGQIASASGAASSSKAGSFARQGEGACCIARCRAGPAAPAQFIAPGKDAFRRMRSSADAMRTRLARRDHAGTF